MKPQTSDMDAFVTLYRDFSKKIDSRVGYVTHEPKIKLFGIYVSRME